MCTGEPAIPSTQMIPEIIVNGHECHWIQTTKQ